MSRIRAGSSKPADTAALRTARVGETRVEQIRLQLADDIATGLLAPGTSLDETELAARFDVSRTPVREAIRLLAASGLVQSRPHRSAVVARPSKAALIAMFEALMELESLCARLAAERATRTDIAELVARNKELEQIVRIGDASAYHRANEAFHYAIYAAARNDYLAELTAATRARIAPFSRVQFQVLGRMSLSNAEHEAIIAAIRAQDGSGAARLMREHIEAVHDNFSAFDPTNSLTTAKSP